MQQVATSDGSDRRRYRWCPACRELWVAARVGASCPLCSGRTFAYVGRPPYEALGGGQPALKRGAGFIEAVLIKSAAQVSTIFVRRAAGVARTANSGNEEVDD